MNTLAAFVDGAEDSITGALPHCSMTRLGTATSAASLWLLELVALGLMVMTDVVLTLPVKVGEEALLFGRFLNRFMESRSGEAERMAAFSNAPYMMVRSDPLDGQELKVLTFQETSVASAFSAGWAKLRTGPVSTRP